MRMEKISLEEFDRSEFTLDDLTYEKMVFLWCFCEFPDSVIAYKCGVPKDKISRLRRDKYKINMMNLTEHIDVVLGSEMSTREVANAMVAHVFRNGYIEELHAGVVEEKLLDPKYSRITNDEMKKLMIECCEKMAELLRLSKEDPLEYKAFLKRTNRSYCKRWIK